MKRSLSVALFFALLLALSPLAAVFAQEDAEAIYKLEIRNLSDQTVSLALIAQDGSGSVGLSVGPSAARVFTVQEGVYSQITIACGETATGTLDVFQQVRLVFTPCPGLAANPGEPSMEKIHISDSPSGKLWLYQYSASGVHLNGSSNGPVAGSCDFTASNEVTIYNRPHLSADVFSTQGAGFSIQPTARTSNGWYGFDPGVAQAANIGSFRLRWLPPGSGTLAGGCSSLPVVWAPLPGICYDMPMGATNVYEEPDTAATVATTLQLGEFAEVVGMHSSGDWAQVDLGPGNTGSHVEGWVEASTLNMNGPCGSLPTVSP
jgi:hypothetical protein